ncbi:hypothetical protein [Virgibacillus sp. SK37]|uniref:hypothetical protein n=1 Tax=Virgibacillus sp. SK37 TaxID=403957 RepID=UPI0011A3755E|nr:hypothetical protein [Virgibacillus sp. SK37]
MNDELVKALRIVIREELEPVKKDLREELKKDLNEGLELVKKDLRGELKRDLKEGLEPVKKDLRGELKKDLIEELEPIKRDLTEIKFSQRQLSKDIATSLGKYSNKYEKYVDSKTEALNKRVYKLESEMEQINRQ